MFRTLYSLEVFLSIIFLLFRLLLKFSAPNLLALHPTLDSMEDEEQGDLEPKILLIT